jgi:hypothetical protein
MLPLTVISFLLLILTVNAFIPKETALHRIELRLIVTPNRCCEQDLRGPIRARLTSLSSISIRNFKDDFMSPFKSRFPFDNGTLRINNTMYELHVMEENDISNVAQFIVRIFGGDAINLSQNLTTLEKLIMSPTVDAVNGYSSLVAFAEVFSGLRSRSAYRFNSAKSLNIARPNLNGLSREEQIRMISSTSLVLVLVKVPQKSDNQVPSTMNNPIIASIELRLQPCDAKIPFTLPFIDAIERKLFKSTKQHDLQPYLSNLCVDESYRGCGIGKTLVRCIEDIAKSVWGYKKMYLHVDLENEAALQLYKKEGYVDAGRRWNPFWAGKAAEIGYFVNKLAPNTEH